jgi:hypothetical protein
LNATKGTRCNLVARNKIGVTSCRWGRCEGAWIPNNKWINKINMMRGSNVSMTTKIRQCIGKEEGQEVPQNIMHYSSLGGIWGGCVHLNSFEKFNYRKKGWR